MQALILLFQVVVGALGLVDKLGWAYHNWQERQKGKVEQMKENLVITKQEKANADQAKLDVAALPDSELDERLRKRMHPDNPPGS